MSDVALVPFRPENLAGVEIRYTDKLDRALFYRDIFDNLNPSLSVYLNQESYLLLMQGSSGQIYSVLTFTDLKCFILYFPKNLKTMISDTHMHTLIVNFKNVF